LKTYSETQFVSSGGLALQERDVNNAVTRSYVWDGVSPGGIGGLLEMTQDGAQYNYLYDGKGNVRALIDENQNVVASYAYDPFGKLMAENATLVQPYQFSTKRYYDGFGLNYYGYRFLNAGIGHWMSRDPLGEAGGLNLYGFVGNSPVNAVDPLGLARIMYRYLDNPVAGTIAPDGGGLLYHSQIWFDSGENYGFFDSDEVMPDKAKFYKGDYRDLDGVEYDDELMSKALEYVKGHWDNDYKFFTHNCHDLMW